MSKVENPHEPRYQVLCCLIECIFLPLPISTCHRITQLDKSVTSVCGIWVLVSNFALLTTPLPLWYLDSWSFPDNLISKTSATDQFSLEVWHGMAQLQFSQEACKQVIIYCVLKVQRPNMNCQGAICRLTCWQRASMCSNLNDNSQGSTTFSRWILKAKIVSREFGSYDSYRCDNEKDIWKVLFLV